MKTPSVPKAPESDSATRASLPQIFLFGRNKPMSEQKKMGALPIPINPGSFWLVIYEHRPAVITIAPDGSGFFACGQEECWPKTEVQAWLREIKVVNQ